jgi:hypothetical protein
MRFVLVGISVCLAWVAAWRCMSVDSQHPQDSKASTEAEQSKSSSVQHCTSLQELLSWRTLLDMFTGKYIYNHFTGRGTAVVKAS